MPAAMRGSNWEEPNTCFRGGMGTMVSIVLVGFTVYVRLNKVGQGTKRLVERRRPQKKHRGVREAKVKPFATALEGLSRRRAYTGDRLGQH